MKKEIVYRYKGMIKDGDESHAEDINIDDLYNMLHDHRFAQAKIKITIEEPKG